MDDDDPIEEGFPGLFDPVNLSAPFDNSSYPFGEQNGEPSTFAEEIIAGWLRSSGCDGASRGGVVSVTGGNPAVAVIDISVPCADTGQSLFPYSGGFRMEVAIVGARASVSVAPDPLR
jgi:hypothetical protein